MPTLLITKTIKHVICCKLTTTAIFRSTSSTTTTPSTTTLDSSEYYYDDDEDDIDDDEFEPPTQATVSKATTTTKSTKGYDSFIKSIPKSSVSLKPISIAIEKPKTNNGDYNNDDDEYYYDDEDDYDDDYIYEPPPNKSNRYMPHSETAAPRPIQTTTVRNLSGHPLSAIEHTTPTKDWSKSEPTHTTIQPIINFPKDIFHGIKPLKNFPRLFNNATLRPYTIRTRLTKTNAADNETERIRSSTVIPPTTTVSTTRVGSSTTTRKIYTIRPNRGQLKWKLSKGTKSSSDTNKQKERQQQGHFTEIDDKHSKR